ncbi:MAG: methyltransferase domain-containing protein [bacterium]|nr:methyltransferase domain-containing protein [bacterium]
MSITDLAKLFSFREDILEACFDFLWLTTDFFEKKGKYLTLKNPNQFPKWLVMSAYKSVFDNLGGLLSGEKIYGRDMIRDGHQLQKASYFFSRDAIQNIAVKLQSIDEESTFVDLGCGSANSLISFVIANPKINGVGIDIDSNVVNAAKQNVIHAHCDNRVKIFQADLTDIQHWRAHIPAHKKIFFLASAVLHEFLRDGEQKFASLLKEFKDVFPCSRFFVIEYDALRPEEIKNEPDEERKLFAAMYMLLHPLSNQGSPCSQREWMRLFQKSGWFVKNVRKLSGDVVLYDCLL